MFTFRKILISVIFALVLADITVKFSILDTWEKKQNTAASASVKNMPKQNTVAVFAAGPQSPRKAALKSTVKKVSKK